MLPALLATLVALLAAVLGPLVLHIYATRAATAGLPLAPGGPGAAGHGADLAGPSFHITLCAWSDALGGVFALRGPLGTRGIVVASPADVAAVLGARGTGETAAPKWTPAYGELNRLWGGRASLFTAGPESPTWRAVRRAVAPCFSAAASRAHTAVAAAKASALADALVATAARARPTTPTTPAATFTADLDAASMRLALDVVGQAAFGVDFGGVALGACAAVEALPPALAEIQRRMTDPFRRLARDKASKHADECVARFRRVVEGVVGELRARGTPAAADPSVGAALVDCVDPRTGQPLCDAQLAAEVGTFIMGGFETTAHSLAFALLRVAACGRAQARIKAELAAAGVLTPAGALARPALTPDLLRLLPYTMACVKEAGRLHPVVPGVPRVAAGEVRLPSAPGVRLPRGTFIYVLLRQAQRDPAAWGADAAEFRPERWLVEGGAGEGGQGGEGGGRQDSAPPTLAPSSPATIPHSYLPFSDGPRDCVGRGLAMPLLHVALATLVARFRLALPHGVRDGGSSDDGAKWEPDEVVALTAHPAGGAVLDLTPRPFA